MKRITGSGFVIPLALVAALTSCGGGDDSIIEAGVFTSLACSNDATSDSLQLVDGSIDRIRSHEHGPTVYHSLSVRSGTATIDYMVHGENNTSKALIVLISGGQLDARIEGIENQPATNSSGNFLVRSAHLFAAHGYKVVTIDRPTDHSYFTGGLPNGYAMDSYRTSTQHFQDLNAVITAERISGSPVVFAGTSRGAISAVAQNMLADYILLSAPVTSGNKGTPVGHAAVPPYSVGDIPVHLIWHKQDACKVSKPGGAKGLTTAFTDVTGVEVTGGFNDPDPADPSNPDCDGSRTFHGFAGIESCVIDNVTTWLDEKLMAP